jgi:hypothetical protein
MFWKASSTLLASRAEVSMKERLFSPEICQTASARFRAVRTSELFGLLGGNGAKMSQIALVADQHDDNVGVCMVSQLLKPSCHIVIGLVLADIVDEECADCAAVVGRGDGPIAFLTGGIPDLSLLASVRH